MPAEVEIVSVPAGFTIIPLTRNGSVVAHAMIDDEDLERIGRDGWRHKPGRRGTDGYAVRTGEGSRTEYMHRLVLDAPAGVLVDHKDGATLDNRRSNLRLATYALNGQNQRHRGGSSRFRGVCWDKRSRRWVAYARVNYRRRHIGYFACEEEAARAAAAFRAEHMPFSTEAAHAC